MTLTLDEVRKTKFHMARRTGYEVSEVDVFVDRVEASFSQLTEENQMLKQQVEALKQAQTRQQEPQRPESGGEEPRAQAQPASQQGAGHTPVKPVAPSAAQSAAGEQKLTVTTSTEASSAVVRLVQLATEQSEQLVGEATAEAKQKLDEANRTAAQITTEARTKAEQLESESRRSAERLNSEARDRAADLDRQLGLRRAELFASLEQERDQLQEAVSQLRGFEANYRQSFANHLKQQLHAVENMSVEPSAKPALADRTTGQAEEASNARRSQAGPASPGSATADKDRHSSTPRLDALLGENQRTD